MSVLPIDEFLEPIHSALANSPNLVIVAAPGAGKTTRVPPALLSAPWLGDREILVLEPRRLAAVASCTRIADELGSSVGGLVGYQVRFENKTSQKTRIRFVTEAILARQLTSDPELKHVGCVVLDEFHERSLHTDLAIGLLRELQQLSRPDLRLVVMSATLDAEAVSQFLENAPIVTVPGRLHPVEISYAKRTPPLVTDRNWVSEISQLIREEGSRLQTNRHMLVFLPGRGEISRVHREIKEWAQQNTIDVIEIHGSLSLSEQRSALLPSSQRQILLATNIAETSLTIDGVDTVFDSGFAKVSSWEPGQTFPRLKLSRISMASAQQRAGRAGRQYPGRCFRHWTPLDERALTPFETPEIKRSDITETILFLATQGVRQFEQFSWFDPPPTSQITQAVRTLQMLEALDEQMALTDLGRQMAQLPVGPRLAAVVLKAIASGFAHEGCTLAALLSERDICTSHFEFSHWRANYDSDLDLRMGLLKIAEAQGGRLHRDLHGVDLGACQQVLRVREQLLRLAPKAPVREATLQERARLLWFGFSDRLCRLRSMQALSARMVGGRGVQLTGEQLLGKFDLFLALNGIEDKPDIRARLTYPLLKDWVALWAPRDCQSQINIVYQDDKSQFVQQKGLCFRDLMLEDPHTTKATPAQAAPFLPQIFLQQWPRLLEKREDLSHWLDRLEFLKKYLPEEPWPDLDLVRLADEICLGETSLQHIEAKDLLVYFDLKLSNEQQRLMREHAPARITVPSGRQHKVEYPREQAPYLKVRLQEIFGLTQTPRLAKGRVALVLHILGPNYRPVQVTADLESFWKVGYPEVRKEMKARYPKHRWP